MRLFNISLLLSFLTLAISQPAYSEDIDATFSWAGSNNYSVLGQFSFDNDVSFSNQVTFDWFAGSNGALKNFSWKVFLDNSEIYSEVVMENSVLNPNNNFFHFEYSLGNEFLTRIDTGASNTWFADGLSCCDTYTVALQINDIYLSSSNVVPTVKINSLVSPVPEPETYSMLLIGFCLVGFVARRRGDNSQV